MEFPVQLSPAFAKLAQELRVYPQDIQEAFTRGSGPGGQKINKTNNCVELFHVPTGIQVRVQKHREQSKNRLSAYKLLLQKIEEKAVGKASAIQQKQFKIQKQKQRRSRKSKEKMLQEKHHRAEIKQGRKSLT